MCTITLFPSRDGVRIACNRDESIWRPKAMPPEERRFGERSALFPIDPSSDGTWIAVNNAGLAMVILNRNPSARTPAMPSLSRGLIIPSLLDCDDLRRAEARALDLDKNAFAPFRLLLADRRELRVIDGGQQDSIVEEHGPLLNPRMFTSSALGDQLVEGPRRELFHQWLPSNTGRSLQIEFHRHSWPDRQHLSVCMRRPDASTVSFTTIELRPASAHMTYSPQAPDERGPAVSRSLTLQTLVLS